MGNVYEGSLNAAGLKTAIVISRFNSFITEKLLQGARDCLIRHGALDEQIDIIWVPGSFEIALIAQKAAATKRYDAIICLGAIIRGSTPHFDYVAAETSKGIAQVALKTDTPVAFGVLTTDSIEQAIERAGTKAGNKGFDAAMTVIEMASVIKAIQ